MRFSGSLSEYWLFGVCKKHRIWPLNIVADSIFHDVTSICVLGVMKHCVARYLSVTKIMGGHGLCMVRNIPEWMEFKVFVKFMVCVHFVSKK